MTWERQLHLRSFLAASVVVLALVLGLFRWFAVTETPIPGMDLTPAADSSAWTFALADGKMVERNSIAWDWGGMSLLFAGCVFALQGSILSQTMEKDWRRSLIVTAAWMLSFVLLMAVQICILLNDEPLFDVLRPVSIANPVWLAVSGGFLAAALALGVIARIRFAKVVVSL